MGNVVTTAEDVTEFKITDSIMTLVGPESIIGRCCVIHEDLGKGGVELSKTTGNAGARLACGVVGIANNI